MNESHTSKIEIDLKEIQNEEYKNRMKEQLKREMIAEYSSEIEEEIRKKQALSNSISSVLDYTQDSEEPIESTENTEEKYLPWWKKLLLKADPFPTVDGLGSIAENQYEEIIIKTSIYEKFVSYIRNTPEELFKNTIFYGQFDSGKTTLFEYLQKPMIQNAIYAYQPFGRIC